MGGVDFAVVYENIPVEIGYRYQATTPRIYRELRKYLRDKKDVSLLDVGCGKGRMLKFFSKCSLYKVDGLEYSKELVDIAKNNMKILSIDSNVYRGDASQWNGYDEYNYFYLFNPFGKDVMAGFLGKLVESYKRNQRKITIIYLNPKEAEELKKIGFREKEYLKGCSVYEYGEVSE